MRIPVILLVFAALLWTATMSLWLADLKSPYESIGIDTVSPQKVNRGGTISISRSVRITREAPIGVVRTMVRGDCSVNCEIIDLPSGSLTLAPGDYLNVKREHRLPLMATPGVWRLAFAVTWEDKLGRTLRLALQELSIEVID